MGFLAKLIAPHVGAPEHGSPAPESSTTTTTTTTQPAPSASQIQQTASSRSSPISSSQTTTSPPAPVIDTSSTAHLTPLQRHVSQLGLFALGAGFMAASVLVTRRAVIRRKVESIPRYFHSSHLPAGSVDSGERSTLAAQALGLATLNVASFGVLLAGGTAWAFDLCSVAELQARTQAAIRRPVGEGVLSEEDEREVDNMVVGLMERLGMDVEAAKEKERLDGGKGEEKTAEKKEDK